MKKLWNGFKTVFGGNMLGKTLGTGLVLFLLAVGLAYFGVTPQSTAARLPKPDALKG